MTDKVLLEQIIARRRKAMGPRPSLDELLELRMGDVAEERRQALLERAAVDPEVAADLLDVLSFPDLPPQDDEQPMGSEQVAERWSRFKQRLEAEDRPAPRPVRAPGRGAGWMKLAAAFAGGVLLTYLALPPAPPRVPKNVEVASIAWEGGPAVRGESLEVTATASWVLLSFGSAGLPEAASYGLELRTSGGELVRTVSDLVPGRGGLLTVLVPAEELPPGSYQAWLFAGEPGVGEPVARAFWTLEPAPP